MSIEQNTALIQRTVKAINDRDIPALLDCVHDDGSWSIPYREDRFPFAGFRAKAEFGEMIGGFLSAFTEFSFEATNITAQDDRVALEATSKGVGPGGATYENIYNVFYQIKDGKILTAREYFDPYQVMAYVEQLPA